MRALSSREKTIFIVCVCVILVYFGHRFGYQAMQESAQMRQQRFLEKEKELRRYRSVIRQESAVRQKLIAYKQKFGQVGTDEKEMTKMLADVETAAQIVAIKILNMEPARIRRADFYNYFSLSVQIQGPLTKIFEFLYVLEGVSYRFRIDEMRLEKYSLRADELKCQFVVSRFLIK